MERRDLCGMVIISVAVVVMLAGAAFGMSETVGGGAGEYTVKLQIDKPYCVLNFMETLRTRGYYGPTLYDYFKKSKYGEDEEVEKLAGRYSSLRFTYPYHFEGYPKYRFMAKDRVTSDMLFTLSARSETLEELKQMTVGIIPLDDHKRLFEVLEAGEEVYDELIWKPYYEVAKERLTGLRDYGEKVEMGKMPGPIVDFFGSAWSADIPVIVSFAIVPGEKIKMIPPPIGNVIRGGLLTDSNDYSWQVAVILHEFSHRAFAEMPLKRHQEIDGWITESRSPHRGMVNLMLNEVLGGAVGHKVREDLLGGAHEFTYGQSMIREFDEAVYPLVVSYMDQGRSIDRGFVDESLAIYERAFPRALYEYHSLFQAYYLLTDVQDEEAGRMQMALVKNIGAPIMYEVGRPICDDHNIDALNAYDFTKLIVVTEDNARRLEYLKGKIGALSEFDGVDAGSDFVLGFHDAERNPYVIINIHSVDAFEEVAKKLKAAEVIDPENPVVRIDL